MDSQYEEAYPEDEYDYEEEERIVETPPAATKPFRKQAVGRLQTDAPAHPLPATRHSHIDYDQYLQSPTGSFRIFSADANRKRRRALLIGIAIGVVIVGLILWFVLGS